MNKNRKKGFTLVELLVVIAILAILAVVTVVGYTSFTKKAKVSNDVSLTTQLNTILQANETTDGANKYPHEAVEELVEGGFDVTKFTPTTEKYNYVYDLSQNRIFLLDESYNVVAPSDATLSTDKVSVFGFAGSQDEVTKFNNAGYSVYLKSTYNSDSVSTTKGIDVGSNESVNVSLVSTITVNSAIRPVVNKAVSNTQTSYVVRTNGGTLTINNSEAVVSHFGVSAKVEITAVAKHSEYGEVEGNIEIKDGELSLESSSNVNTVLVTCESSNTVSINVSSKATIGSVAPATEAAKEVVSNSTSIPTESKVETVVSKTDDFAGGLGTEKSPYVITSGLEFDNIFKNHEEQMIAGTYLYFSQKGNIEIISNYVGYYFNGLYNGNDYNLVAASNLIGNGLAFGTSKNNADIKNLNVYSTKDYALSLLGYSIAPTLNVKKYKNGSSSFENVNTYVVNDEVVNITVANFGFFTYGSIYAENDNDSTVRQISVTFNNCNNYASVTSLARCAAFVGYYAGIDDGYHAKLIMNNCKNEGNITVEGFDSASAIIANVTGFVDPNDKTKTPTDEMAKMYVNLTNVKNNGIIKGEKANCIGNSQLDSLYRNTIGGNYISTSESLSAVNASIYTKNGSVGIYGSSNDYTYGLFLVVSDIHIKDVEVSMSSRGLAISVDNLADNDGTKISSAYAYDFNTAKEKKIVDDNTSLEYKYKCDTFNVAIVVKDSKLYVIFNNDDVDYVGKNTENKVILGVRVYNKSNEWIGNIKLA